MSRKRKAEVRAVGSPAFHKFLEAHGGPYRAARVWGVEYLTLQRFIKGRGGLNLDTAATIAHKVGVSLNDLFTVQAE